MMMVRNQTSPSLLFFSSFFSSRYYDTDEEQMVHILVREIVSASAPNKGAQRLRTFLRILVVPNNAVTCIPPITSGIPNSLKYRGRRLGGGSQLVDEYDGSQSDKIK